MYTRCFLQYFPKTIPPFSLKLVLAQFIYAQLGRIPLYESSNAFTLEYDCQPHIADQIQEKVNVVMPQIELSSTRAVFWQLFLNGVYYDSRVDITQEHVLASHKSQLVLPLH